MGGLVHDIPYFNTGRVDLKKSMVIQINRKQFFIISILLHKREKWSPLHNIITFSYDDDDNNDKNDNGDDDDDDDGNDDYDGEASADDEDDDNK